MIIDLRARRPHTAEEAEVIKRAEDKNPCRCFVDGVEIQKVWYVDTEAGIVKADFDAGNGETLHVMRWDRVADLIESARKQGREICDEGQVITEIYRGRVELV